MAHFCLIAITRPGEDLAGAMRPFHADDSGVRTQAHFIFHDDAHADRDTLADRPGFWRNPLAKWDGWVAGGNWHGLLTAPVGPADPDAVHENSVSAAALARPFLADGDRIGSVFALLVHGRWLEVGLDAPPGRRWIGLVTARLSELDPSDRATVIDCHC